MKPFKHSRSALSLTSRVTIVRPVLSNGDGRGRKLYFTYGYPGAGVGFIDLDRPGDFKKLASFSAERMGSIRLDLKNKDAYVADLSKCRIVRFNLEKPDEVHVLYNASALTYCEPTAIAIDPDDESLYWTESNYDGMGGKILRGSMDGSLKPVPLFESCGVIDYSFGLALDSKNKKIYFSDFGGKGKDGIYVGNLDGTGTPQCLYSRNEETLYYPSSIAIDAGRGKIYWADEWYKKIVVANSNGTGSPRVLFDSGNGLWRVNSIAIDESSEKIYWAEAERNIIARGNLDGSGDREIILKGVEPYTIALRFDET